MPNPMPLTPMARIWYAPSMTDQADVICVFYTAILQRRSSGQDFGKGRLEVQWRSHRFQFRGGINQEHHGGRGAAGHVVVIRNEGPVGGPGMREMLSQPPRSWARVWEGSRFDHRWSILRWQPRVRGRTRHPRSGSGRTDWLACNGDPITIDAEKNELTSIFLKRKYKRLDSWVNPT